MWGGNGKLRPICIEAFGILQVRSIEADVSSKIAEDIEPQHVNAVCFQAAAWTISC